MDVIELLNDTELAHLRKCEDIIKSGLNTFLEVGRALAEIRDNRLYRAGYKTFERYCKDVWDLSKTHVNRQISAQETVKLIETKWHQLVSFSNESKMSTIVDKNTEAGISTITDEKWSVYDQCLSCEHRKALSNRAFKGVSIPGAPGKCTRDGGLCDDVMAAAGSSEPSGDEEIILPINEAQTRPLTKLSPDDQIKAWVLVLQWMNKGKKLTSGLVGKAAKQIKGETIKSKIAATKTAVETTELASTLFKRRIQDLLDAISDERNNGWQTTSPKYAVKSLQEIINIIEMDK